MDANHFVKMKLAFILFVAEAGAGSHIANLKDTELIKGSKMRTTCLYMQYLRLILFVKP